MSFNLKQIIDYLAAVEHLKFGGGRGGYDGTPRGGEFGSKPPVSVDLIDLEVLAEKVLRSTIREAGFKQPARGVSPLLLARAVRDNEFVMKFITSSEPTMHRLLELQAALSARVPHTASESPAAIFLDARRTVKAIQKHGLFFDESLLQRFVAQGKAKAYVSPNGTLYDLREVLNAVQSTANTAIKLGHFAKASA